MIKELLRRLYYLKTYIGLKSYGKNMVLSKGGLISRPHELEIGDNFFIARGFHISARDMKIGNNVLIGPYFLAECDNHIYSKIGTTIHDTRNERDIAGITIESDIWIGGHVTVLKGVTIGEGCIVGAGSVVTKSLPPYTICFGAPCKVFKKRFTQQELELHLQQVRSDYNIEEIIESWTKNNLI